MKYRRQLFSLIIVLTSISNTNAQDCSCQKLQSTVAATEHQLESTMGAVRLRRREDLEDQVFLPKLGGTDLDSPVFFYQVEDRRYYLLGGEIAQTDQPGAYNYYVVISRDASHVYKLGGFPEAEADLGRLVKDYPFPVIRDSSDAEQRALFCSETLYAILPRWWILNQGAIKLDLVDHFLRIGASDPFHRADRWWSKYRAKHPGFRPDATLTETGPKTFLVRIPYFLTHAEGSDTAEIRELTVEIRADGTCHRQ
jgi:hypothetical protein